MIWSKLRFTNISKKFKIAHLKATIFQTWGSRCKTCFTGFLAGRYTLPRTATTYYISIHYFVDTV
jgi:hypothetical protein